MDTDYLRFRRVLYARAPVKQDPILVQTGFSAVPPGHIAAMATATVIPVAALGLGWVGVVIVVLIVLWLLSRVF